jgi:uncharacterized protein HemX
MRLVPSANRRSTRHHALKLSTNCIADFVIVDVLFGSCRLAAAAQSSMMRAGPRNHASNLRQGEHMKLKLMLIACVLVLASGCATNGREEMESRLNAVEQTANEALTLARQAQSQAAQAENAARSAQNSADRALQAANEANERARRMAEVGPARK